MSLRRRRLPAERIVWLVIGLALFRDEPIWHIVQQLDLADGATPSVPVPDDSLTVFDHAYFSAAFLLDWQQAGQQRHWLMRAKTPLRYEVVHQLAPDDFLMRMPVSPQARKQRPELPIHWEARLIKCMVGGQPRQFLTSLYDAQRLPAREIAAHLRAALESELGFRKIKQGMLKNTTTPVCSPQSNGMAESFVKTMKRDYVAVMP